MSGSRHLFIVIGLLLPISAPAIGQSIDQSDSDRANYFENRIRPVLVARCIQCHGPTKSESGLRLDKRQSILAGGDSGPALIPGDVAGSLLASVLDYQHDIKMPPNKPLSDIEIQAFQQWIAQGAFWPEQTKLSTGPELRSGPPTDEERAFWAFQPLNNCQPPAVEAAAGINNDIDRFVLAKLREQSLKANSPADKGTLIRRITFDLTGLPPTPESIEQFVNDDSPDALQRLVDRLLDSPAYGERWGRHWLDVVRYSDTAGETADYPVPDAWRYRNYVIDAFNKDKPYDQFLLEQIAGDILAYQDLNSEKFAEQITATGFIAIARRFGFDSENYHHLTIQDTIDTIGQAALGLSFGCARCHDHKFDPISMEDYYALYGIFESTLYPLAGSEQKQKVRSLVPLQPELTQPRAAAELTRSVAARQQMLQKLGRPIPPVVLRSLTELDGDFELQSPASGGSRGVLVAPWLYDGPISVTGSAQSPFASAFPKGKVGLAFHARQAIAGVWQALNHRSVNLSLEPLTVSVDFRVGSASEASAASRDVAADLAATAKSIGSTRHHGLRIDLCQGQMPAAAGLLIGSSTVQLQVGDQLVDIGTVQSGQWYNLELIISPESQSVSGFLTEHNSRSTRFELPISSLPNQRLTLLRIQTSQQAGIELPDFDLDNLAMIPGKASQSDSFGGKPDLAMFDDLAALEAELKKLVGIDGDLELQADQQPPAKPWNPGPNSVVKVAAGSQSPFRNFYAAGALGIHLPNRSQYDGFGLQLEGVQPDQRGHLLASFDFRCASQDLGGSGSWRYYLGHGPGNSAAVELFFNGSQFFRRSSDAKELVAEIKVDCWYQVQLDLDLNARSYSGKLLAENSQEAGIEFTGQLASGWDGIIDYTFIDSYGHIGGVRPALDADNFSLGQAPRQDAAAGAPVGNAADVGAELSQQLAARRKKIAELRGRLAAAQMAANELENQLLQPPAAMSYAVAEGTPHDVPIQLRGEPSQPGKLIGRRMPELFSLTTHSTENLPPTLTGSGRLELANWITQQAQPLAARVMVNRVWQQHFGRGLVRTENDFGTRGELPTHPELLDWLACRFIESGWSIKQLHRLILSSAAYQRSSQPDAQCVQADPENRWLWRFSPRRLSAEEIRDAMLLVSGMLDPSMGQSHPFPAPHTWGFTQHAPFYAVYDTNRRSVYLMQQRLKRHPFLALFDGADPNVSTARREMTTVPTQALYLMNNPFVHEVASGIAESCMNANSSPAAIESLYRRCLGRKASSAETSRAIEFLDQYEAAQSQTGPAGDQSRRLAWAALARTLLIRNEFLFVE